MVEWVAEVSAENDIQLETVELLAALKNNAALVKRGRRWHTLITWTSVAILALLSAGYTTLLLPLPITLSDTAYGYEPDMLVQDSGCARWFQDNYLSVSDPNCRQTVCGAVIRGAVNITHRRLDHRGPRISSQRDNLPELKSERSLGKFSTLGTNQPCMSLES